MAGLFAVALLVAGAILAIGSVSHVAAVVGWADGGDCAFVSVHEGDTIRCDGENIRIANIDAPELEGSPRCEQRRWGKNPSWCDYRLGIASRDALKEFVAAGPISVGRVGKDGYGRTLAMLEVDGIDAGRYLLDHGLARQWIE